jgi:peptide deformylase
MNTHRPSLNPPLSLRLHPDPVLRRPCMPVEQFDSRLADLIGEMRTLMMRHNGIGLAAPQAGLSEQFFVVEISGQFIGLINPLIVSSSGQDEMEEGCLSLPGRQVRVLRKTTVDVAGYNILGNRQLYHLDGLWARAVQHELDHLNGMLICDYETANHEVSS